MSGCSCSVELGAAHGLLVSHGAMRSVELDVADVLVTGHDAVALQALVVGARDLVQPCQRALKARVVVQCHPGVIGGPRVLKIVPCSWVLHRRPSPLSKLIRYLMFNGRLAVSTFSLLDCT